MSTPTDLSQVDHAEIHMTSPVVPTMVYTNGPITGRSCRDTHDLTCRANHGLH